MRPRGSRNARYNERRSALLDRLTVALCAREDGWPTLRQLATAADCSVSTLVHYFGRREDLVEAVLRRAIDGLAWQLSDTRASGGSFAESIDRAADRTETEVNSPVISRLLAVGMIEGLSASAVGPVFLDTMLDPFIAAMAGRLDDHVARGEMRPTDTRLAAIDLIGPILMASLHQRALGGAGSSPLDTRAHARQVAQGFIAAYGTTAPAPAPASATPA